MTGHHRPVSAARTAVASLRARISTLEQAGVDELLIQPVLDPATEMARLAELLS